MIDGIFALVGLLLIIFGVFVPDTVNPWVPAGYAVAAIVWIFAGPCLEKAWKNR